MRILFNLFLFFKLARRRADRRALLLLDAFFGVYNSKCWRRRSRYHRFSMSCLAPDRVVGGRGVIVFPCARNVVVANALGRHIVAACFSLETTFAYFSQNARVRLVSPTFRERSYD
jgi:hypothetical protein